MPKFPLETLHLFIPPEDFNLALLILDLEFVKKGTKDEQVDAVSLANLVRKRFANQYYDNWAKGDIRVSWMGYMFAVNQATVEGQEKSNIERGMVSADTCIMFEAANSSGIKIVNQWEAASSSIFWQKEFNLQSLGIGGLGAEFSDIFRRAFASRVFPPHVTSKLGIKHVKGMLLFGPPGTGKTLMARQIGKMLNGKEPKTKWHCDCDDRHQHIYRRTMLLAEQVKVIRGSPLITCLVEGPSGSGKTAMAATVGIESDFPYLKIISAETMIGLSKSSKCSQIVKTICELERREEGEARLSPVYLEPVKFSGSFAPLEGKGKKCCNNLNVFSSEDVDSAAEVLND
ncbi:vesicle-fusing ATPase [Capsicum annuum]